MLTSRITVGEAYECSCPQTLSWTEDYHSLAVNTEVLSECQFVLRTSTGALRSRSKQT